MQRDQQMDRPRDQGQADAKPKALTTEGAGIGKRLIGRLLPAGAQRLASNVLWNWAGMGIGMMAGFVVAPFLVHRLGDTTYGLWILIASLTGYFGLLDFGVRSSVGRYVAFHHARNDQEGVNAVVSTASAILSGVAVVALLATIGVTVLFFHLFEVPPENAFATRMALLIVGLNLALSFPLTIFDGTLWAFQRFDLINAVDIPTTLIRTALTFYLIGTGHGLVALAVITLVCTVGSSAAKGVAAFGVDRAMRLRWSLVTREAARRLFIYGFWHFMLSVGRQITGQISSALIGAMLSIQAVTPFSIASRLIGYAAAFLSASTGVLTPFATVLHAQEKHGEQKRLFVLGGKYCFSVALFFMGLFLFLGRPLVGRWMGWRLADSSNLLVIMTLGEVLPMSQLITHGMIIAMARHKVSAWMGVVETAMAVALGLALLRPYGLSGLCIGFAISGAIWRGVFPIFFGCWLMKMPVRQYVVHSLLVPLLAAVPPAVGLAILTRWITPVGWLGLLLCMAGYGVMHVLVSAVVLMPSRGWRLLERGRRAVFQSVGVTGAGKAVLQQ